jgi:phenylpyruvate tautomerase
MPLLRLEIGMPIPAQKKEVLLLEASKIISHNTGQPETYVMVLLTEGSGILGGRTGPVAFADVRSIGSLDKKTNGALAKALCDLLKKELDIAPDRVFLNFTEIEATRWAWKGSTVG